MISKGLTFKKHSAVRAAFHKEFVKSGIIPKKFGLLYDTIIQDREDADYVAFALLDKEVLKQEIEEVKVLIQLMKDIVQNS